MEGALPVGEMSGNATVTFAACLIVSTIVVIDRFEETPAENLFADAREVLPFVDHVGCRQRDLAILTEIGVLRFDESSY